MIHATSGAIVSLFTNNVRSRYDRLKLPVILMNELLDGVSQVCFTVLKELRAQHIITVVTRVKFRKRSDSWMQPDTWTSFKKTCTRVR